MFVDFHWGVYSGATEAQVSLASHSEFMLIKPLEVHVYAPCYKKFYFREVTGVPIYIVASIL